MKRRWWKVLLVVLVLSSAGGYLALRQVQKNRLPEAVWQCLRHPQQVAVYSLRPEPGSIEAVLSGQTPPASDSALFRGFRIIARTDLTAPADQRRATSVVEDLATTVFVDAAICFDPRHGIRVSDGKTAFDFVICYDCQHMLCCEGDKTIAYIDISGSSKILETFLLAASAPTKKASEQN